MLTFLTSALTKTKIDILAVPVCEDADLHTGDIVRALIAKATVLEEFSGEKGQQVMLFDPPDTLMRRCLFVGMGKGKDISLEKLRRFAGKAVAAAQSATCSRLVLAVPDGEAISFEPGAAVKALAEGAFLANHVFKQYKADSKDNALKQIALAADNKTAKSMKGLLKQTEAVCGATLQAREWVSTPSNDKPPMVFAKAVSTALAKSGVKITVHDEAALKRRKFGSLLAVSAGSANKPCMVEMVYAPKAAKQTVVLVGKGVTFDSGGINLKPAGGLDLMKIDMAGAAAVAGTLMAAAKLKPSQKIIGLLPLVENMPSGTATRPGDVVTSYAGKTIEIGNTDAEGRLILADAMAYAEKRYKPDVMIDMATLTGACMVALGEKIAGVFSTDDGLARTIVAAGQDTHERCWHMPLPDDYKELLKSDVADLKNIPSTRYGGAITAALFLSEFVSGTRWAHIDIAGPAHAKKGTDYCGPGGTGFGVRLLTEVISRL